MRHLYRKLMINRQEIKSLSTGLYDIKGTLIFEFDKIQYDGKCYVVRWDLDNACFYLSFEEHKEDLSSPYHATASCIKHSIKVGNALLDLIGDGKNG